MQKDNDVALSTPQLKIYVYLLESGEPRTVRDIAEALSMPSSSVHYHLKKLVSAGIVELVQEGFRVSRRISIEGYVFLWRRLIPRLILYSFFFIGLFIGTLAIILVDGRATYERLLLLFTSGLSAVLFMLEGLRLREKLR